MKLSCCCKATSAMRSWSIPSMTSIGLPGKASIFRGVRLVRPSIARSSAIFRLALLTLENGREIALQYRLDFFGALFALPRVAA